MHQIPNLTEYETIAMSDQEMCEYLGSIQDTIEFKEFAAYSNAKSKQRLKDPSKKTPNHLRRISE